MPAAIIRQFKIYVTAKQHLSAATHVMKLVSLQFFCTKMLTETTQ